MTTYTWYNKAQVDSLLTPINSSISGLTTKSTQVSTLLAGTGIDLSGATDSTTAVQALFTAVPDGTTIRVPDGAIINLTSTINVTKRIRLTGAGELRWTAGIASSAMLSVTVDGCHFDGLYLTNPNHLAAQYPSNRTYGIYFQANYGRVTDCRIVGQQQAVCVAAAGEFHDFTITGNQIIDVPGSGSGPSTTDSLGEDRGDGIMVWGTLAVITGNRVAALAGTDARIGIHVEALTSYEVTPYTNDSMLCTIVGNVVTGKFRRGITSEGVRCTTIVGNTVAESTEWGINLSQGADASIIADNTIRWTRLSSENQGSPAIVRSALMVYGRNLSSIVRGNTIAIEPGTAITNGITVQSDSAGGATDLTIDGNTIVDATNTMTKGIAADGSQSQVARLRILNNKIRGFLNYGVYSYGDVPRVTVQGNELEGTSTASSVGVHLETTTAGACVEGNTIRAITTGVEVFNRTGYTIVNGNIIDTATTGINLFGSTGKATVNDNTFVSVTGSTTTNLPTGVVTSGNN